MARFWTAVAAAAAAAALLAGARAAEDRTTPQAAADAAAGAKRYAFELPLASPLNDPNKVFIAASSFGNREWDPVAGMPVDSGPSPDFRHSLNAKVGSSLAMFPDNAPPVSNPNQFVEGAPTGVSNAITDETLQSPRFRDTRLNADGVEVGLIHRRQLRENVFPSEGPFPTNRLGGLTDANGGELPLLVRNGQ